jgi:uncharacterized protein YbjT (DUF2867 family)
MSSETKALKKLLVLGGSGLVGTCLVQLAAKHPAISEVVAPVRKVPQDALTRLPSKVHWLAVDFDQLEGHAALFEVDVVLCALGTTIRKAGSREAFEAVDLELPLRAGRLARSASVSRFGVVSSTGADPNSSVPYLCTKGRLEAGLVTLEFEVLVVARPSLLLGHRAEKRFGEDFAKTLLNPIRSLVPGVWRPIQASQVARQLLDTTLEAAPGTHILDNAALLR